MKKYKLDIQEQNFFESVYEVIKNKDFPKTKEVGFAFLRVLEHCDFEINEINTLKSPVAGSIYLSSEITAILFKEIDKDAIWWRSWYQNMGEEEFNQEWIKFFIEIFQKNPLVRNFVSYL